MRCSVCECARANIDTFQCRTLRPPRAPNRKTGAEARIKKPVKRSLTRRKTAPEKHARVSRVSQPHNDSATHTQPHTLIHGRSKWRGLRSTLFSSLNAQHKKYISYTFVLIFQLSAKIGYCLKNTTHIFPGTPLHSQYNFGTCACTCIAFNLSVCV